MAPLAKLLLLTNQIPKTQSLLLQLRKYGHSVDVAEKKMSSIHPRRKYGALFLHLEQPDVEFKILSHFKADFPYLPIVALAGEGLQILDAAIIKLASSILRLPATDEAVKKLLLKLLWPQTNEMCRIYDRINIELDISWNQSAMYSSAYRRIGKIKNLSLGGAFIYENGLPPPRGEILDVVIGGLARGKVFGKAIVRWVSSRAAACPGFGIEFIGMDPTFPGAFERLV